MKYFFAFALFWLLGISAFAQFYEFGQDPGSLKWKKLDSGHFQIIYPSGFSDNAQRLARLMEKNYTANSAQLNHEISKIPLIIHNQSVYSNAFVTWAPKRMEFFTFPSPDQFPIDWLTELSLHETRHVIQIDKLNKGFTRILSTVLGQQATGAVAGLMPLWFIEGDAVCAETSLSESGRGRLPSFEMELKAQLLSGKRLYPLSKAYLGSYRDFVPDYYRLGYQMVSFAQKNLGEDYWTHALDYIARKPFLISPYYFYSKKTTGHGQTSLYKNTMASLKDHWSKTAEIRNPGIQSTYNHRNSGVYTSYSHPILMPDSSVIALKTGLNTIPQFVKIERGGDEKLVFTPGSMVSERFSVYNQKIIWDEYVQDIRWKNRSYSIIREYNTETGKSRNISRKSKYISPSWSDKGDSIVVVNAGTDYLFSLVILDAANGRILKTIPSPGNCYLQYPEWIRGKGKIAVITTGERGKSIFVYDLITGSWSEILKTGFINVDQLKSSGDYLFFTGGFNGMDEIYSITISDKKLRKHTNSAFGAFQPDVSSDLSTLVYSGYGLKGYDIILKPFNPDSQELFEMPDTISEQTFASVRMVPDTIAELESEIENTLFEEKPYRKASHLFNLHSWAPFWYDYNDPNIDDPHVSPGITLLSQNHLSTAFSILGYERNNGYNYLHSGFTYKGFVPVFEFTSSYGGISDVAIDTTLTELKPGFYSTLSTYIPLTITSGKFISGMQPSLLFTYKSTYYAHSPENVIKSGIVFFEPRIYLYSYLRTSRRDLQTRLGFTFDARYTTSPLENDLYGSIQSLRVNLYLPGIIRNQGLKLKAEWQNQDVTDYYFMNHLSLPRGYFQRNFIKINKYSADYAFPVVYPDFSLGSLLYLKRVRGNLFVESMTGVERYKRDGRALVLTKPENLLSQGLELFADYHIFRFIVEFSSGARFSYLPYEKTFGVQLLFAVNLDKF